MIKEQVKSGLRNRANKIYVIVFIILFLVMNISINIKNVINQYFDLKMEKYIYTEMRERLVSDEEIEEQYKKIYNQIYNTTLENVDEKYRDEIEEYARQKASRIKEANEELKSYEEFDKSMRTMYVSNVSNILTEQNQKDIKKIKHVQEITSYEDKAMHLNYETQKYEMTSFIQYEITVDDWKNSEYVRKRLDNIGVSVNIQSDILLEYNKISGYANIIEKVSIIMAVVLFIACCKNILKNEEENIKLLEILGYNKKKINLVKWSLVLALTMIGFIIGYIVSEVILLIVTNNVI